VVPRTDFFKARPTLIGRPDAALWAISLPRFRQSFFWSYIAAAGP
jgi:hypothetical protein